MKTTRQMSTYIVRIDIGPAENPTHTVVLTRQQLLGLKLVVAADNKITIRLASESIILTIVHESHREFVSKFCTDLCDAYRTVHAEFRAEEADKEFRPGGSGAVATQSHFEELAQNQIHVNNAEEME